MKKISIITAAVLVLSSLAACSVPSLAIQQTGFDTSSEYKTEYPEVVFSEGRNADTVKNPIINAYDSQDMELLLTVADNSDLLETKSSGELALLLVGKKIPPIKSAADTLESCKDVLPDKSVLMDKDSIIPHITDRTEILSDITPDKESAATQADSSFCTSSHLTGGEVIFVARAAENGDIAD